MGTRVVQVKCPKCNEPIKGGAARDIAYECAGCGTVHMRQPDGKVETIERDIAGFDQAKEQAYAGQGKAAQRVYLPFWVVTANVQILGQNVAGGALFRLANWISGNQSGGLINIYVPAFEIDAERFKYLSTLLTSNPPASRKQDKFENGAEITPTTVSREEAIELADFIVLSNEAEKPGVLQSISYRMEIAGTRLSYLAFHRVDGSLVLA